MRHIHKTYFVSSFCDNKRRLIKNTLLILIFHDRVHYDLFRCSLSLNYSHIIMQAGSMKRIHGQMSSHDLSLENKGMLLVHIVIVPFSLV